MLKSIFNNNQEVCNPVSCVVAPGFDFADFELFTKDELLPQFPDQEAIISRLT